MKAYWSVTSISVLDQPSAASMWPDIIFEMRIEMLTLTNLYFDMHEGMLRLLPLYLYLASLQYQPPAASRRSDTIFDMRSEIPVPTNLHLDIPEGILEIDLYICTWRPPGSASSGLQ